MSRINIEGDRLADVYIERGFRLAAKIWVPADAEQLSASDPPLLIPSPAGAINLRLPASNDANRGLMFAIFNPSANTITMQTSGGAGFTTAITILTLESTIVFCTGHATAALGWRGLATALST